MVSPSRSIRCRNCFSLSALPRQVKTATSLLALLAIAAALSAQEALTNDAIVKMVESNVSEGVIVEKIRNSPGTYSLTSENLIELVRRRVPGSVILAMQAKSASMESGSQALSPYAQHAAAVPCPVSATLNYFDAGGWKPMTMAPDLRKKRGLSVMGSLKNPLDPMAGHTTIRRFEGAAAALTLGPSPRFCVYTAPGYNPAGIVLASVTVKNNERQIESGVRADSWIPEKNRAPIETKRLSDTVIEIVPTKPLAPGQYIINGPLGVYDFGVEVPGSGR